MFFSPQFVLHQNMHGLLKGCFLSLKGMGEHKDIQTICQAIEAMLVLHDICIDWNDHPDTIWEYNSTDIWESWDGVEDRVDDEDEETEVGIDDIEGGANIPKHETPQYLKDEGR